MSRGRLAAPRRILITGATGSLGSALARLYAGRGVSLALHGRDATRLERLAEDCRRAGAEVEIHAVDLAARARLRAWLDTLAAQPTLDLAIVNAGLTSHIGGTSSGESWSEVERLLEVNLVAAIALTEALLPGMRAAGRGQVALVSSLSAYFGLPLTPSYCASKAGLMAYGEALRGWLAPQGVAVNVVLPGFVRSAMSDRFPGPRPFMLSPERAAGIIRRGLARDKARIAFPIPLSWAMWWLAVLPVDLATAILRRTGYAGAADRPET
jgi:short-subunit dehydrogenase